MAEEFTSRMVAVTGAVASNRDHKEIEMLAVDRLISQPDLSTTEARERFRENGRKDATAIYAFLSNTVPGATFDALAELFIKRAEELGEIERLLQPVGE